MHAFIPEDYLCTSPRPVPVPLVIDPFADDFVLAKCALAEPQDAQETTTGCTSSMAKFVDHSFTKEVAHSEASSSGRVGCTVEAQNVATQVPSEDFRALNEAKLEELISLPLSSLPRQQSEADTDTQTDTNDAGINIPLGEARGIPLSSSLAPAGVCIISAETARKIFKTKRTRSRNDGLACRLGKNFGITAKAVRDIWRLRTWTHATWPLWAPEDMTKHFTKKLCVSCRNAGLTSIHQACMACKNKVSIGNKC